VSKRAVGWAWLSAESSAILKWLARAGNRKFSPWFRLTRKRAASFVPVWGQLGRAASKR